MSGGEKRILHLIESADIYGAERVILNLSEEMTRTGRHQPVVGCIVESAASASELFDAATRLGLEAIRIPIDNRRLPFDVPRAARLVRRSRVDLIHTHGYKPVVFGYLIHLLTGIPTISTSHLWSTPEEYPLKMRVMVWLSERLYRRFPVAVAVSEPIRAALVRSGVAEERALVIANGVEIREPAPGDLAALRRELGLSAGDFVVLNAGRLTRQKAQWLIVEAAARLMDATPRCRFLIVGEGESEADLRESIRRQGLADCVQLLGFRRDMPELLALADVFILPSLYEGMPMSLLEATAGRVPVIATPVGDIPRLIVEGVSGLLIPVGDSEALARAIARLRDECDLGGRLANAALAVMKQGHSSAAMCRRYTEVYDSILPRA